MNTTSHFFCRWVLTTSVITGLLGTGCSTMDPQFGNGFAYKDSFLENTGAIFHANAESCLDDSPGNTSLSCF